MIVLDKSMGGASGHREARRDFSGCMDPGYLEYNPDATHGDASACRNAVPSRTAVRPDGAGSFPVSLAREGNALRVDLSGTGNVVIELRDLAGKPLAHRLVHGPGRFALPLPGEAGVYIVRTAAGDRVRSRRLTRFR